MSKLTDWVARVERERDEARAEAANARAVLRHETNYRKQAEAEIDRLRAVRRERDVARAELAQHDCAETLGVREAIKALERESDEAYDAASEWLGLLTALDDIMVEAGRDKKAQPKEAQAWLRAALHERDELARKLVIEQDQTEARGQDVLRIARERDEARAEVERLLTHDCDKELESLRAEVERLKADNAEWERRFDLYYEAEQRGIKMWQASGPGRDMIWPDKGKMTAWLLAEVERLRASPPAVCVVDVEGLRDEIHAGTDDAAFCLSRSQIEAIIKRHNRRADPEAVAMAIGAVRHPEPSSCSDLDLARAALAHLGVALAEKPAAPAPGGWLIEVPGPLYWTGRDGCGAWADHNDAIRFARWEDADRLRRTMGFERATCREHAWIPRATEAQREPEIVRPVPAVESAPAPGGFVPDIGLCIDAYYEDAGNTASGIRAAIAEYERQRAEHAKRGGAA